jgi:hypothetical protein
VGWPIYSVRFLATNVPNVYVRYTVPIGTRAVLREAVATNFGTAPATVTLIAAGVSVWKHTFQASLVSQRQDFRQVVYGGEKIEFFLAGADMSGVVAGYLFNDTAGGLAEEPELVPGPPPTSSDVVLGREEPEPRAR